MTSLDLHRIREICWYIDNKSEVDAAYRELWEAGKVDKIHICAVTGDRTRNIDDFEAYCNKCGFCQKEAARRNREETWKPLL